MGRYNHRWTIYRAQVHTETAIVAPVFFLKNPSQISYVLIVNRISTQSEKMVLKVQGYNLWEETT